ncbi:MAG TPA: hypothetical protein VFR86_03185 [Burkholderiaceae bacterium]|nr:hypothetical protein [Burkholderiaceae bacterium]
MDRRPAGNWSVCEAGFETAIAEFESRAEATRYALRYAATHPRWQVDVVDGAGDVLETYNGEETLPPRPRSRPAERRSAAPSTANGEADERDGRRRRLRRHSEEEGSR